MKTKKAAGTKAKTVKSVKTASIKSRRINVFDRYPVTGVIRFMVHHYDAQPMALSSMFEKLGLKVAIATCRTQRNHAKKNHEKFPIPTIDKEHVAMLKKAHIVSPA